ncbi:MAG: DUF1302 domain-containing protein [Burkholderiales bacterium]|nr:DUF1302 domain-containing protein [Burkholderiales bacterium]
MTIRKTFRCRRTRMARLASALGLAALGAVTAPHAAHAIALPTPGEDLRMNWDNTLRYNLGLRVQKQDPAILASVNADDGDRNFGNGTLVTNRLDLLSEFDLVWQQRFGLRVSAAAWYDGAYSKLKDSNTASANTLVDGLPVAGRLSGYSRRYARGGSGEFLDSFLFANLQAGSVPVNVKLGRHTAYWGESLLLGGLIHGIAYAQNSVDAWKLQATPGAEAKEFIRPRGGLTMQVQPTSELSLVAQWFYEWQAVRAPESGSYLAGTDMLTFGGDSLIIGANPFAALVPGAPAALRLWNTQAVAPTRSTGSRGDWGLAARWSPKWLEGTVGAYLRNATDILPQLMVIPGVATVPAATCSALGGTVLAPTSCLVNPQATSVAALRSDGKAGLYQTAYGTDIRLYGLSLSKSLEGVSLGAELSYRQNMPLVSDAVTVLPAPLAGSVAGAIATSAIPARNDTPGARGNTWHGLVNGTFVLPGTALFDTASIAAELTWMQLDKVTQNAALYKGRDGYTAIDKPTRSYWGLGLIFTPTWFQALTGVDLSLPISWSQGISGNAATTFGGNRGTGTWSAGLAATAYQNYSISLSYIGYFGRHDSAGGAATVFNGSSAAVSDRGWVSLTLKTTF